jgi:hypothetical protein
MNKNGYNIKEVLPFAGDFESAHSVNNYPYGRQQTTMKFWTEFKKGKGFRAVTCSLNPKTGKWNKPHAGTYTESMALYIEEGTNHTKFAHFSHYDRESAGEFYAMFESGLSFEGKQAVKYWQFTHEFTNGRSTLEFKQEDFLQLKAEVIRKLREVGLTNDNKTK